MRLGYARQYEKSCIIVEEGDLPEKVIERAEIQGAVYWEGPETNPDNKSYVVRLPGRPDELYSKRVLMNSLPFRKEV